MRVINIKNIKKGDTKNSWTILETPNKSDIKVLCKCVCGNIKKVNINNIIHGKSKSCGCLSGVYKKEREFLNAQKHIGDIFGRLQILEVLPFEKDKNSRTTVKCLCECGNTTTTKLTYLKNGNTRSCGCLQKENTKSHGLGTHELYKTWYAMMQRCYNEESDNFHLYGGRGIKVCKRWHDIRLFIEDMSPRPEGLSLDRVDTNGNYEPSNCRWADWTEQNLNKNFYNENKLHNIRVRENGDYCIIVTRNKRQRKRVAHSLDEAITIRDKWKKEYLENKEKWIKETELNMY